jgi:hypothetical protein
MTCDKFIKEYCDKYKLVLTPYIGNYYKGYEVLPLKILIYILKTYWPDVSFRYIAKITYRSHPDIVYHFQNVYRTRSYINEDKKDMGR